MKFTEAVVLYLLATGMARAQAPAQDFTSAPALLDAVAKTYAADAATFHLESTTESLLTNEFLRDWRKSESFVIKGPHNSFRIEVHSPTGSWLQASDGTTEWVYVREAKMYVRRAAGDGPQFSKSGSMGGMGSMELKNAWQARIFLNADAEKAKEAIMLPAETITVGGHSFSCYVVHATSEGPGWHKDRTLWIEKKSLIFRKIVEHGESYTMVNPILKIPMHEDVTTLYPVVEFNSHDAPESLAFTPPPDAKEVATLEPEWPHSTAQAAPQGAGKPAPDISLTAADGKQVKLSTFRGQPLLIDVWATWCAPCLAWMPSLGKLEKEMRGKGLQVISVDYDENAASATHYMAVHEFTWPNYHDGEGKLAQALGEKRIPLTLLIDAKGRIVYEGVDSDEAALRKAIAGLGSQMAAR